MDPSGFISVGSGDGVTGLFPDLCGVLDPGIVQVNLFTRLFRTWSGMTAVKVIKVLGTSEESWNDAAEEAVSQASETIDDIHGVEVEDWTAEVDGDQIVEYRATVEIAFPVHENRP